LTGRGTDFALAEFTLESKVNLIFHLVQASASATSHRENGRRKKKT
jgi:hypothetical protein